MFKGVNKYINEDYLGCITRMVNQEQNDRLISLTTMAELHQVVFSMNPQSAAGPYCMNG